MKLITRILAILSLAERGVSLGTHEAGNSIIVFADNFNRSCDNLDLTIHCKQEAFNTTDTDTTLIEKHFENCCHDAKSFDQPKEFKNNTHSDRGRSLFILENVFGYNVIFLVMVSVITGLVTAAGIIPLNLNFTDHTYDDKKTLLSFMLTACAGISAARIASRFQDPASENSTTAGKIIYAGELCFWKITRVILDGERNRQRRVLAEQRQGQREEGLPLIQLR